ncbi:MAG: hypothetical protein FJ009_17670 [Chloroflexi bacterium]|nr:hypothetical protein [Chloroflexota bacterium]
MNNLKKRIERIEEQLHPDPEAIDWRERIRRNMRGEYVPPESRDWRTGKSPEEIEAVERIAFQVTEMEKGGASADEIISRIEGFCREQTRAG